MGTWEALLAGPRGDFPRGPAPRPGLPGRPWIVALLLVACLIPRIVAAWNWDVLWGDSLRYRYASLCLERGDFEHGFAEFGLNIYPLILIPLRHLGIDWQIAGKYFNVLVAALTVLPLWGWLRRVFDDRLAVIACLVYALHGKLIAISPLIIRDSTFWFLLVLTFYYVWRAVGEVRIGFFLAAGMALTLAVHTRTEGWLLLIPLLGWGACRWSAARGKRLRLVVGVLLCMAVIPATVSVVNFTWLRTRPRWEILSLIHLQLAVDWWNSATGMHLSAPHPDHVTPVPDLDSETEPPPAAAISPVERNSFLLPEKTETPVTETRPPLASIPVPAFVPPGVSTPGWLLTLKLLERLVKGCSWMGSFLLLVGLVCSWRIFLRPEHLTLFCLNLALLAITRIRYGVIGLDLRYFMPIVIVGLPWMALGLEHLIAAVRCLLERRGKLSPRALRILAGSLIAGAVACGLLDGSLPAAANMRKHAAMGRWIYDRAGPKPAIAGNIDHVTLDTFYSRGHVVGVFWPRDCLKVPMPVALTQRKADVVVLWNKENLAHEYLAIIEQRITGYCGYRRIDEKELPARPDELMVFVRQ